MLTACPHQGMLHDASCMMPYVQVECEHQLAIERDRGAELARQRTAAEQRAQAAQQQAEEARRQLEDAREEQRASPAGLLQQQVSELRGELRRAEERAARAVKAKNEYKQQVGHRHWQALLLPGLWCADA
jgi:centrosomal protein CEP120